MANVALQTGSARLTKLVTQKTAWMMRMKIRMRVTTRAQENIVALQPEADEE